VHSGTRQQIAGNLFLAYAARFGPPNLRLRDAYTLTISPMANLRQRPQGRNMLALTAFLLMFPAVSVHADTRLALTGKSCSKSGLTRTVRGVSYRCSRLSGTLKWKVVAVQKSSTTSSTSSTTTSVPRQTAAQLVAEKINTYVAPMRLRNQPVPVIEYRFSPSVSEEDRVMTRQLAESFFKYGSFPELAGYRSAVSVSLSNAEAVETTAPWMNVSGWGNIAGGYTGTGTYALVVQNYTAHRCGTGAVASTCAANGNGGSLGRYRLRVNVLHELSHGGKVARMGYDPTQVNFHLDRMPMWMASGISNIQGAMLIAVIDGAPYLNPNISESEARRCAGVTISKISISESQLTNGGSCRGTGTGDFANEILVARFGLDKVLEFIAGRRNTPLRGQWQDWSGSWAQSFREMFLQSPESFERDVETYRDAVVSGSSLPSDFLDAKSRP
jgi:hypothetical protein